MQKFIFYLLEIIGTFLNSLMSWVVKQAPSISDLHFSPEIFWSFVFFISILITLFRSLSNSISSNAEKDKLLSTTVVKEENDFRKTLINVMKAEVAGRLLDNLHNKNRDTLKPSQNQEDILSQKAKIKLEIDDQPESVNRPEQLKLQIKTKQNLLSPLRRLLPPFGVDKSEISAGEEVINIFHRVDIAGKLLILGNAGSGKTTTLLELADSLLKEANQLDNQSIPFIFELSNWKDDKLSIADWLAAELKDPFKIPEIQTKQWLENGQLLPLLDGLDELGLEGQVKCIKKVDECLQAHPALRVVVCCRLEEYKMGELNFEKLRWAISIQPLKPEQIENYLGELDRLDLWQFIKRDPDELLKLAEIPLLLHLMPIAYSKEDLQSNLDGQTRNQLFEKYIDKKLEEKPNNKHYSAEDTKRWLEWLARQMKEHNQTEFLLEKIQPYLLPSYDYKILYQQIWLLILCMIIFTSIILFGELNDKLFIEINFIVIATFASLICSLIFLPFLEWILKILQEEIKIISTIKDKIHLTESMGWNTKVIIQSIIYGLVIGLILGLLFLQVADQDKQIFALIGGLSLGLLPNLIVGLFAGMIRKEIRIRNKPNQGIIKSVENVIILGLVIYVLSVLPAHLFSPRYSEDWSFALTFSFILTLPISVFGGGGIGIIQHYTLRFLLWRSGATPLNYVDFLNYATERRLLQRVGGRYRFLHDLLREHLANSHKGDEK